MEKLYNEIIFNNQKMCFLFQIFVLLSRYNFYQGSALNQTISLKTSQESSSDESSEASEPECDLPFKKQLQIKNIEKQNEMLLAKFEELLCSKFNSGEISEQSLFSVERRDLQESFIQFCETQNVDLDTIKKLRTNKIKFKDLVLAYDPRNVYFDDGMVNIFITSDSVESFEASNRKFLEGRCNLIITFQDI